MSPCPYCGDVYIDPIHHKTRCVAEQVVEEQSKVLNGIAEEIEARDSKGDFEDIVEQLKYSAKKNPEEMKSELEQFAQRPEAELDDKKAKELLGEKAKF